MSGVAKGTVSAHKAMFEALAQTHLGEVVPSGSREINRSGSGVVDRFVSRTLPAAAREVARAAPAIIPSRPTAAQVIVSGLGVSDDRTKLIDALFAENYLTPEGKARIRELLFKVITDDLEKNIELFHPITPRPGEGVRLNAYCECIERAQKLCKSLSSDRAYQDRIEKFYQVLIHGVFNIVENEYVGPNDRGGGGPCMFFSAISSGRLNMDAQTLREQTADALMQILEGNYPETELFREVVREEMKAKMAGESVKDITQEVEPFFEKCRQDGKFINGELHLDWSDLIRYQWNFREQLKLIHSGPIEITQNSNGKNRYFIKHSQFNPFVQQFQIQIWREVPEAKSVQEAIAHCLKECDGCVYKMYIKHLKLPTSGCTQSEMMAMARVLGRPVIIIFANLMDGVEITKIKRGNQSVQRLDQLLPEFIKHLEVNEIRPLNADAQGLDQVPSKERALQPIVLMQIALDPNTRLGHVVSYDYKPI